VTGIVAGLAPSYLALALAFAVASDAEASRRD
jgi:hypothetical protein